MAACGLKKYINKGHKLGNNYGPYFFWPLFLATFVLFQQKKRALLILWECISPPPQSIYKNAYVGKSTYNHINLAYCFASNINLKSPDNHYLAITLVLSIHAHPRHALALPNAM